MFLGTCVAMFCTSATFAATAFSSPSPPCHFLCTSHIPSLVFLPHLPLLPQIPICYPDICCHETGFDCLPFLRFPFWRCPCSWNRNILYFPKSPKVLQSDIFYFLLHVTLASSENSSKARMDNRINSVPKLCSRDLSTFGVALLFCHPQRFWHHVIAILFSVRATGSPGEGGESGAVGIFYGSYLH
jgi:hypothetical protein